MQQLPQSMNIKWSSCFEFMIYKYYQKQRKIQKFWFSLEWNQGPKEAKDAGVCVWIPSELPTNNSQYELKHDQRLRHLLMLSVLFFSHELGCAPKAQFFLSWIQIKSTKTTH